MHLCISEGETIKNCHSKFIKVGVDIIMFVLTHLFSLSRYHPILPLSYYVRASQKFPANTKFIVFCEQQDKKEIQNELQIQSPKLFAQCVFLPSMNAENELMMMTCCKGGILANSTFSVWAAYAQQYYGKHNRFVYAYEFFVHAPHQPPQIFDPTWMCLKN
jgi:hypothetical protein